MVVAVSIQLRDVAPRISERCPLTSLLGRSTHMSHVAIYKSRLKQVHVDVLKRAIGMAAKTVGGKAGDSITNYGGGSVSAVNGLTVVGAITTNDIPRGVGVVIGDNGEPKFVGDFSGCRDAAEKLQKAVESAYIQIAISHALQQQGYTVESQQGARGVLITGERA